jgi:DNA-directed RNA polymerase specialized sigma subunit
MTDYIDNKRFEHMINLYVSGDLTVENELISNFTLLIDNIIQSFHFKVDSDDARQECFLLILRTLKNFKPTSGSGFNYFTTVIINNLRLLYSKNKRYDEKITNYTNKLMGINTYTPSGHE